MADDRHLACHARRCIACGGLLAEHTPARLAPRGFREHQYDPGERRASDPLPRAVVWTAERRRHARELAS